MNDASAKIIPVNVHLNENVMIILRLYVAAASPNSLRAIANSKQICETYFPNNHQIEIIDIYQKPVIARDENIIALPLLVRKHPLPEKRLIGDLSDSEKVLNVIGFSKDEEEWMLLRK
jgi:circadian clock protein KaiB